MSSAAEYDGLDAVPVSFIRLCFQKKVIKIIFSMRVYKNLTKCYVI